MLRTIILLAAACLLASCGGGGDDSLPLEDETICRMPFDPADRERAQAIAPQGCRLLTYDNECDGNPC